MVGLPSEIWKGELAGFRNKAKIHMSAAENKFLTDRERWLVQGITVRRAEKHQREGLSEEQEDEVKRIADEAGKRARLSLALELYYTMMEVLGPVLPAYVTTRRESEG
jgi:hypothetical protein